MNCKIEEFKELVQRDSDEFRDINGYHREVISVKSGKKYTKIDRGGSGYLMVEQSTGNIYGIKAYGVIHRGHCYGNLDTIHEWFWGAYGPKKKTEDFDISKVWL